MILSNEYWPLNQLVCKGFKNSEFRKVVRVEGPVNSPTFLLLRALAGGLQQ